MQLLTYDIHTDDLTAARAWDEAQRRLGRTTPEDAPFLRWLAGASLARGLGKEHPELDVRWHAADDQWPGLLELVDPRSDAERHVFVLAEPTSMEPRPVWPVRVPIDDASAWEYDAVAWCYIPKRAPLEAQDPPSLERGAACAGWAWVDELPTWKPVHLEPHAGHPFAADVWQTQVAALREPSSLVSALFAGA